MVDQQRPIRPQKRKESSPDSSTQIASNVPTPTSNLSKVSHKSIACIACQKKRRKCNGAEGSPCSECVKLGIDCVFDKDADRRRRPQRERARKDRDLLHKLFDALKTWPESDITPMLHAIHQTGASITDLEDFLDNSNLRSMSTSDHMSVTSKDPVDGILDDAPSSAQTRSESMHFSPQPRGISTNLADGLGESSTRTPMVDGIFASPERTPEGDLSRAADAQYPPAIQREQIDMENRPEYLATPALIDSNSQTEPLTRSALSFLYTARNRIARGESINDLLSMEGLDLDLYFRVRQANDPHTVSTWACELAKAFVHLSFPLHMNIIHTVGTFMRWLILPCQETWEKMNRLMRPLKSQVLVPHASLYADLVHIPQLRLAQLTRGTSTSIEELIARPNWVDCNWRFANEACFEVDEGSGLPRLSEAFVEHINDMRNWSVHRSVLEHYPEVGEADNRVNLHDDELPQQDPS